MHIINNRSMKCLMFLILLTVIMCFPAASYSEQKLIFGVHPYLSPSDLYKRFTPLVNYLSDVTGHPVSLEISKDYDDHISKIGNNEYDIAYMGPVSYVLLTDSYGKKPIIAGLEVKGKTYFYGFIIAREDSGLRTLLDLKGKRFAFGDHSSTMSHIVPRYMLLKSGIDFSDLTGHSFLGTHDNVALGVLFGDYNAGAVKEETFYKYQNKGLRKLARTPEIAEHIFVSSSTIPKELYTELQAAMFKLSDDDKGLAIIQSIKKGITGFVEFKDKDYDNLREILNKLKDNGLSIK